MSVTTVSLETIELAAWEDVYAAAPPAVAAAGIRHMPLDGVLVATAPEHDVLAMNRALGIGVTSEGTPAAVDRVLDVFRSAGSARCMIPVAPPAAGVSALLAERGLYHHNSWVKAVRDASPPPRAETDFLVRRLNAEHGDSFGTLIRVAFDWPEAAAGLIGATVGRDGWVHYGAFDGNRLAAAGGMFLRGESAWLGPAATDPDARGRGAQSALIVARLNEGIERGGRQFVVETAEPKPEKPVTSLRNLRRLGFEVAYVRPNWVGVLR